MTTVNDNPERITIEISRYSARRTLVSITKHCGGYRISGKTYSDPEQPCEPHKCIFGVVRGQPEAWRKRIENAIYNANLIRPDVCTERRPENWYMEYPLGDWEAIVQAFHKAGY